jgi:gluconokinase
MDLNVKDFLISMDLGTSSVRVALIGFDLKIRHQVQTPVRVERDGAGGVTQDAEAVIAAGMDGLRAVLAWAAAHHLTPEAISFSNASASLVCLDADYQPLAPALTYLDLRSHPQVEQLQRDAGWAPFRFSGAPLHASYWLSKLLWLAEHKPELRQAAYFCTIKDLFVYRLTGQFVTDAANAGADGICDVRTCDWDPALLGLAEIREDQLPQVAPTTRILEIKPVSPNFELTGFPELKVVLGAMDGLLSSLGAGAFRPGQVTTTIGSSGACRVAAQMPLIGEGPLRTWSYPLDEGLWIRGGAMNNGGLVTRWLVENFSKSGSADDGAYRDFFEAAGAVAPGADGLLFLPYLYGERAPIYDEHARGVYFGLTAAHSRAHLARAGLEGILFALYSIYDMVRGDEATSTIRATGGYLRSELMLQIQADIFGLPIATPENLEGSVVGAAMLGMKALDVIQDYAELDHLLPTLRTFEPEEARHAVYQENYQRFKALYRAVKPLFQSDGDKK